MGHLLRRPHARPSSPRLLRDLAAVRPRPRDRQRRLLPRLRPGARARARAATARASRSSGSRSPMTHVPYSRYSAQLDPAPTTSDRGRRRCGRTARRCVLGANAAHASRSFADATFELARALRSRSASARRRGRRRCCRAASTALVALYGTTRLGRDRASPLDLGGSTPTRCGRWSATPMPRAGRERAAAPADHPMRPAAAARRVRRRPGSARRSPPTSRGRGPPAASG